MKHLNKFLLFITLGCMFFILSDSKLYCQLTTVTRSAYHNLGVYQQRVSDVRGNKGNEAYWPGGLYRNLVLDWNPRYQAAKDYIAAEGAIPTQTKWWEMWWKVTTTFTERVRNAPPSIIIDGIDLAPPFRGEIVDDLVSNIEIFREHEDIITIPGTISEYTRSYANQLHDDYVIWDWTYLFHLQNGWDIGAETYIPEQTLNCYMATMFMWEGMERAIRSYESHSAYRLKGTNAGGVFPSPLKAAGKISLPRTEYRMNYFYDDHTVARTKPSEPGIQKYWTGTYSEFDNTGSPVGYETGDVEGEFAGYAYTGHAIIHADKSVDDTSDDVEKPKYVGYIGLVREEWVSWPMQWYDFFDQEGIRPTAKELGYDDYRDFSYSNCVFQFATAGPYMMNDGDDFRMVYASAAGGIDKKIAWEKGNEFMQWYRDGIGDFDNTKKNELLATGMDSLIQAIDRAYWTLSKNYDIPDPPPVPNIEVTSGPACNYVKWWYDSDNDFKDHDTQTDDFGEWRVYRKRGNMLVLHPDDAEKWTYDLVYSTTNKDETEWTDTNVIIGKYYHYAVTCVDDGSQYDDVGGLLSGNVPLESSRYLNRTLRYVSPFAPGKTTTDNVTVAPNPYSVGTKRNVMLHDKPDDLHIVNLPPYCTIKIYTATGDLMTTLEHTDGSAKQVWTDMRTISNQQPVSGVYIVAVINAKDLDKNPLPDKFAKFVIVR